MITTSPTSVFVLSIRNKSPYANIEVVAEASDADYDIDEDMAIRT